MGHLADILQLIRGVCRACDVAFVAVAPLLQAQVEAVIAEVGGHCRVRLCGQSPRFDTIVPTQHVDAPRAVEAYRDGDLDPFAANVRAVCRAANAFEAALCLAELTDPEASAASDALGRAKLLLLRPPSNAVTIASTLSIEPRACDAAFEAHRDAVMACPGVAAQAASLLGFVFANVRAGHQNA